MNLIKKLYDAVTDDIQPLTTQYVSAIISQSRRKRQQSQPKILTNSNQFQDSDESIQQIREVPDTNNDKIQNVFKRIPIGSQIEDLTEFELQLSNKLEIVKRIIVSKSPGYLQSIDQCLSSSQIIVNEAQITKPKVTTLKITLKRLEMSRAKSQKIVNFRIKYNNIKLLLNYLRKLPNLDNMKLPQLKRISLQPWLKQLKCYEAIEKFIQIKSEQAYSQVILLLQQMIILMFDQRSYRQIVIKYIQLEIQTSFDELLLSVLVKEIRKFDISYIELTENYISYMKNFYQIYMFHKNNPKLLDLQHKLVSLFSKIWKTMQQHLVQVIRQTVGLSPIQLFELSLRLNNLIEIGQYFKTLNPQVQNDQKCEHCSKIGQQIASKQTIMFNSTFNKFLLSVNQSLNIEQSNQWSRLPVDNFYRHNDLKNTLCTIINRCDNQNYKKLVENDFYYLRKTRPQIRQNTVKDWKLIQYKLDTTILSDYKIKSIYSSISQISIEKDVVISQSILPILKFYQQSVEYVFSLRLTSESILAVMFFLTNFYLYFVFNAFTPPDAKKLFYLKPSGSKQIYEKAKINSKYPHVIKFISIFQQEFSRNGFDKIIKINQSKLSEKIIRARVVALESFSFLYKYLEFCINNLRKIVPSVNRAWEKIEKRFNDYPFIQKQLSELLYSECIYKLTSIDLLLNPIWKTSLDHQESQIQLTLQKSRITLQTYMKDFLKRLQADGKGQIPLTSLNQIYILFCKYISRFIQNKLIRLDKATPKGKQMFIKMLQHLQKQMNAHTNYLQNKFTLQIIQLVKMSNTNQWKEVEQFIKQSINNCHLSFTGLTALAINCKASQGLQKTSKDERAKLVDTYIKQIYS